MDSFSENFVPIALLYSVTIEVWGQMFPPPVKDLFCFLAPDYFTYPWTFITYPGSVLILIILCKFFLETGMVMSYQSTEDFLNFTRKKRMFKLWILFSFLYQPLHLRHACSYDMLNDFNLSSIFINFFLIALIFVLFFCIHSNYLHFLPWQRSGF